MNFAKVSGDFSTSSSISGSLSAELTAAAPGLVLFMLVTLTVLCFASMLRSVMGISCRRARSRASSWHPSTHDRQVESPRRKSSILMRIGLVLAKVSVVSLW